MSQFALYYILIRAIFAFDNTDTLVVLLNTPTVPLKVSNSLATVVRLPKATLANNNLNNNLMELNLKAMVVMDKRLLKANPNKLVTVVPLPNPPIPTERKASTVEPLNLNMALNNNSLPTEDRLIPLPRPTALLRPVTVLLPKRLNLRPILTFLKTTLHLDTTMRTPTTVACPWFLRRISPLTCNNPSLKPRLSSVMSIPTSMVLWIETSFTTRCAHWATLSTQTRRKVFST